MILNCNFIFLVKLITNFSEFSGFLHWFVNFIQQLIAYFFASSRYFYWVFIGTKWFPFRFVYPIYTIFSFIFSERSNILARSGKVNCQYYYHHHEKRQNHNYIMLWLQIPPEFVTFDFQFLRFLWDCSMAMFFSTQHHNSTFNVHCKTTKTIKCQWSVWKVYIYLHTLYLEVFMCWWKLQHV